MILEKLTVYNKILFMLLHVYTLGGNLCIGSLITILISKLELESGNCTCYFILNYL